MTQHVLTLMMDRDSDAYREADARLPRIEPANALGFISRFAPEDWLTEGVEFLNDIAMWDGRPIRLGSLDPDDVDDYWRPAVSAMVAQRNAALARWRAEHMRAWIELERTKGRLENELIWSNCVRETGLLVECNGEPFIDLRRGTLVPLPDELSD